LMSITLRARLYKPLEVNDDWFRQIGLGHLKLKAHIFRGIHRKIRR